MPGSDAFSTLAEVAVAFLGFTGVVGIFGGRGRPPAVTLRLWVMVELGLALLLLALLPMVLHELGSRGAALWTLCSGAAALFVLAHFAFVVPRIVPYLRAGTWGRVPGGVNGAVPALLLASLLTQGLNAAGLGLERSHGGYLLGLFLVVAGSGLNFFALLVVLRASDAEPGA